MLVLSGTACGDDDGEGAEPSVTEEEAADGTGDDGEAPADGTGGDDEDDTETEAAVDDDEGSACALLTLEDVTEALPDEGEFGRDSGSPLSCTYSTEGGTVQATLTLQPGALAETSFEEAVAPMTEFEGAEPTPVEDLGDEAVQVSQPLSVLLVAVDEDLLSVSVLGDVEPADAQRQLAEAVVGRMQ
jgi:hypothetical protein